MPPKKVTIKSHASTLQGFEILFAKPEKKPITETKTIHKKTDENKLKSENPDIQAFYDSLSENERIAHTIAVEKLGTSYDVTRTHGFLKWNKARK